MVPAWIGNFQELFVVFIWCELWRHEAVSSASIGGYDWLVELTVAPFIKR